MLRTVTVSSVFNAPADVIWARLGHVETLRYIARPFAYFTPLDDDEAEWKAGAGYRFRFRVFGVLPMGIHHISVARWDRDNWHIETHESDHLAKIWNHTIRLEPQADSRTKYTDIVEIDAGRLTWLVKCWSLMFYRHRQRRWKRLLSLSNERNTL